MKKLVAVLLALILLRILTLLFIEVESHLTSVEGTIMPLVLI